MFTKLNAGGFGMLWRYLWSVLVPKFMENNLKKLKDKRKHQGDLKLPNSTP